jgi:predicted SprT family Zn-dependent metalloprotease
MELTEVQQIALKAMAEHGLYEWTLKFDRAKQRAGVCRKREKIISLSAPLMNLWTREQCTDTILHEIAHALTKGGHGYEWQAMCVRIGADPTRTWGSNGEQSLAPKYVGTCPNGHVITRMRLTSAAHRISCSKCAPYYDARYRFTWREV